VEAKAAHAERLLFDLLGGRERFDSVDVQLLRFDRADAASNAGALAHLRVTVKDRDPHVVGRRFSNAVIELSLAGYAGFFTTTPPTAESAYGVYWPTTVPIGEVEQRVVLPDSTEIAVPHVDVVGESVSMPGAAPVEPATAATDGAVVDEPTVRVPLGALCGGRSGDKGGNANVGLWVHGRDAYAWLVQHLTVARFRDLVSETADLDVRRYELPNLLALNFVVVGVLGEGVGSSVRIDPQAKGLAEYVRSRLIDIPSRLMVSR
jgi:hypothetical protein